MAIFGDFFASYIFSEPRAARFRPALKFALRPHHATAEIRRGKKEETTGQKYNGLRYYIGRP